MFGAKYAGLVISAILCCLVYLGICSELDRPELRVDEAGNCISAVGPDGPISCKQIKKNEWWRYDVITQYEPPK